MIRASNRVIAMLVERSAFVAVAILAVRLLRNRRLSPCITFKQKRTAAMRLSLKALIAFVSFASFACVALTQPTRYSLSIVATSVLLWLTASVVFAIYTSNDRRPFWVGFAVFGWSFLLAQTSLAHPGRLFWLGADDAILWLGRLIHGDKMVYGELWRLRFNYTDDVVVTALSFEAAAYYVSSIVVAFLGGVFAVYLNARSPAEPTKSGKSTT